MPSQVALSFSVLGLIVFCQPSHCVLNSNPFKIRELFKVEFRIGEVIQKLPSILKPHHEQLKEDVYRSLLHVYSEWPINCDKHMVNSIELIKD